jgi:hypothetical protein
MINRCQLCNKEFEYPYLLERHKNNKKPCNLQKMNYNCDLCKTNFDHKSHLDIHNKTKKHIKNVNNYNINNINNIHIGDNNITINNNITIVRGFSETNINVISLEDFEKILAYNNKLHYYINLLKSDPDDIYYDAIFIEHIFKLFIVIFEKLNFNLAFTENHNCNIFSFTKSSTNFIEYQLLEIDNANKNYFKKCIEYKFFIEEFLKLMNKINNKFNNSDFNFILNYTSKFKKYILDETRNIKHFIENELLYAYSIFEESKLKVKTEEEEFQYALLTARNNAFRHILG